MEERPTTRYAKTPDGVSLAFHVIGEGSLDLVFLPGLARPIDLLWEDPGFVHFAKRLQSFTRSVWHEGRGIGSSGGGFTNSDNDLTSILDAVGCERAVLVAHGSAGPVVINHAANHADRVSALILIDSHAYYVREDDYPWGIPADALERQVWPCSRRHGDQAQIWAPYLRAGKAMPRSTVGTRGPSVSAPIPRSSRKLCGSPFGEMNAISCPTCLCPH